ncbi:MAG: VPS10 domain-containing protein [Candidatus Polarisedimenticolia bacterium]
MTSRVAPGAALLLACLLVAAAFPRAAASPPGAVPAAHLRSLKWRSVGPANMGGRVSSIAVHPSQPWTFFAGLGTGGLMKSTDNGVTWSGVFEKERVASIGAVAIAPSDPNVVWVGTGEANGRNSSSWGDGVYRSSDGGSTWQNVGLRDTHSIARIVVHPTDPATAWVAAMGHLWGSNKERGVFLTTDAGRTWTASLQIDETVGCIDLVIDPSNPRVLYAAMYHRLRRPWSFVSGGKGGGIYKTADGGRSWIRLTQGLPTETGRIGLDVHRADPRIVYAVIESDAAGGSSIDELNSRAGGVFRSDDAGGSWQRVNQLAPRAFYFSQIRVDPKDPQRVYVLGYLVHVSDDGGRTFRDDGAKAVHVDHHDLWIDPDDTNRLLLGNDGGLYASYSRAKSWDFFNNMAVGEFYRVTVDSSTPYRIAGGLQDNFNWIGPSATMSPEGIGTGDWRSLGGGDGFTVILDPAVPDIVYAESQEGYAFRLDLATGQRRNIRPLQKEGSPAFRFHWNTPFILSPHDATVLYMGGNKVFRLTERGDRWQAISPDLSTQDPARILTVGSGAENYGMVYTLAESPLQKGLLWAGTDDGRIWLTEDAGAPEPRWTELTAGVARADRRTSGVWVSRIEASHHDAATAYVAVDGHTSDLFAPLAFMTTDRGRTWTSIAGDLPAGHPVKVVREDLVNPALLFAGTEFGIFASFDRGRHWTKLGSGLPTVAVDDIVIHPREMDLVIATHGRSIYVMDDIRPLQELTPEVLARDAHLFTPRPARAFQMLPEGARWSPRIFKGDNPPFGTILSYHVKEFAGEEVSLSLTDAAGRTVRTLTGGAVPGINRVVWDLQLDKDPLWDFPTPSGQPRLVPPGDYTVSLSLGSQTLKRTVTVTAHERYRPE